MRRGLLAAALAAAAMGIFLVRRCARPPARPAPPRALGEDKLWVSDFKPGFMDSCLRSAVAAQDKIAAAPDVARRRASTYCECVFERLWKTDVVSTKRWEGIDELNYKVRARRVAADYMKSDEGKTDVSECREAAFLSEGTPRLLR